MQDDLSDLVWIEACELLPGDLIVGELWVNIDKSLDDMYYYITEWDESLEVVHIKSKINSQTGMFWYRLEDIRYRQYASPNDWFLIERDD